MSKPVKKDHICFLYVSYMTHIWFLLSYLCRMCFVCETHKCRIGDPPCEGEIGLNFGVQNFEVSWIFLEVFEFKYLKFCWIFLFFKRKLWSFIEVLLKFLNFCWIYIEVLKILLKFRLCFNSLSHEFCWSLMKFWWSFWSLKLCCTKFGIPISPSPLCMEASVYGLLRSICIIYADPDTYTKLLCLIYEAYTIHILYKWHEAHISHMYETYYPFLHGKNKNDQKGVQIVWNVQKCLIFLIWETKVTFSSVQRVMAFLIGII